MELRELRTFCAVIEQGGFSKAGSIVHLSQPTISLQIKSLEEELKVRLIDRLDRKILLTPAGQILYQYAQEMLKCTERIKEELRETTSGQKLYGKLTIGTGVTIGENIMPTLLSSFKKKYSNVELALRILDTSEIIKQMLEYQLDMGIVGAEVNHKDLILEKFTSDRLVLIVPPTHPWVSKKVITLSELSKEPMFIREEGSGTRMSIQNEFKKMGIHESDINILMELGSTGAIKQAVMNKGGVAIVNHHAVQSELKAGLLCEVSIKDFVHKKQFYLVLHRRKTKSRVLEIFLQFLKETKRTLE